MESVNARTFLEMMVVCPYCNAVDDKIDELREFLNSGELSAENLNTQLSCSDCNKPYIVNEIVY